MLQIVASCISAANGSAIDTMSTTGKAIFVLRCGLCMTILCQESPRSKIKVKCYVNISFAVVKALHLNWSAISYQMPLLLPLKGLLHKRDRYYNLCSDNGTELLELMMNFENSGSLLHRKRKISKKFWNLQIQKHLNGILFSQT